MEFYFNDTNICNICGSGLIKENVEFVEEESDLQEESSQQEQEEKYYCPECGAEITLDMTHCPKCGVEFEFEEDEE